MYNKMICKGKRIGCPIGIVYIFISLLLILTWQCSSESRVQKQNIEKTDLKSKKEKGEEKSQFPAAFFLLPAPFTSDIKRNIMIDLFTAPLLDLTSIEKFAIKFEIMSRKLLIERKKKAVSTYCKEGSEGRSKLLENWKKTQKYQYQMWINTRNRFETSMAYYLDMYIDKNVLPKIMKLRNPIKSLQQERQTLIGKTWNNLFRRLKKKSRKICKANSFNGELPREKLFLPYYIALYRFYRVLPSEKRIKLILKLHSY